MCKSDACGNMSQCMKALRCVFCNKFVCPDCEIKAEVYGQGMAHEECARISIRMAQYAGWDREPYFQ